MVQSTLTRPRAEALVNGFVRSVYNWMAFALALTGFVAYYVAHTPSIARLIFGNPIIFFVLIFAELGLVFAISGMVNRLSASTATSLFVIYAALMASLSPSYFLHIPARLLPAPFLSVPEHLSGAASTGGQPKRT